MNDTQHLKFETDGYRFHLEFAGPRVRPDHKTRIYVSGQDPITEMPEPPVSMKGDDPANDALWRRYNRLEVVKMREVADAGLKLLLDGDRLSSATRAAAEADELKLRFSKYAGCSCPCSPGFVADRPLRDVGYRQVDAMWITKVRPARTLTMADFDVAPATAAAR